MSVAVMARWDCLLQRQIPRCLWRWLTWMNVLWIWRSGMPKRMAFRMSRFTKVIRMTMSTRRIIPWLLVIHRFVLEKNLCQSEFEEVLTKIGHLGSHERCWFIKETIIKDSCRKIRPSENRFNPALNRLALFPFKPTRRHCLLIPAIKTDYSRWYGWLCKIETAR